MLWVAWLDSNDGPFCRGMLREVTPFPATLPRCWGPAMVLMPGVAFLLRDSLESRGSSECASQCVVTLMWVYGSQKKKIKKLCRRFYFPGQFTAQILWLLIYYLCSSCCLNETNGHRWLLADAFSWTGRTAALEMLGQISVAANQLCGIDQQDSTDFCISGSMREHVCIHHGCGFI